MCGLAGVVDSRTGVRAEEQERLVERMAKRLVHRGPDDYGTWVDSEAGIALAHRRLAILDLSEKGHQPMVSGPGRYVIVFNGEIYNHLELRRWVEKDHVPSNLVDKGNRKAGWRGYSDTETLLACFEAWGVQETLKKAVGMFAIALWDRDERVLYLARDRMGEKPLYYGLIGGAVVFASELKAFRALTGYQAEIDRGALALMMRYSYVPAPFSIYKGVQKLLPGTLLVVPRSVFRKPQLPEPTPYWSALATAVSGVQSPLEFASETEAINLLDARLRESVGLQMMADVPLGAFLSGGVDSSTITALMQVQSSRPVKTFSIGFDHSGYDEAQHAKAIAQHLGTEHTELYVTPRDALDVIPTLPELFCEPFSDSSQIPTHLVSKMAKRHVTVVLSGDAGDELFGGYNRYFLAAAIWERVRIIPVPLRKLVASIVSSVSVNGWNRLYGMTAPLIPKRYHLEQPGEKAHKAANVLTSENGEILYQGLTSNWDPGEVVLGADDAGTVFGGKWPELPGLVEQMMALDAVSYLPDDILVKVDRAAMAVSLETRVPFLDHRVFEYAWRLPLSMKIRDAQGKWILRQVLGRYVPKELIERPKMGFAMPIDSWLRGPLHEWAEELLNETRLKDEGFFEPVAIRTKWSEHCAGVRNWQNHLWDVLMFQAWFEHWKTA